jgi:hypothetical protein
VSNDVTQYVPMSPERVRAVETEYDTTDLILHGGERRRARRDIADGAFRGLLATIQSLNAECLALAKLAADEPQFFNPLDAFAAQAIRDKWLKHSEHRSPNGEKA